MLALLTNLPSAYLAAQLRDGVILMLLGMIVVFFFLTILIYSIKTMSKIVGKNAPVEEPKVPEETDGAMEEPQEQEKEEN